MGVNGRFTLYSDDYWPTLISDGYRPNLKGLHTSSGMNRSSGDWGLGRLFKRLFQRQFQGLFQSLFKGY